jgi:hypothetical protein
MNGVAFGILLFLGFLLGLFGRSVSGFVMRFIGIHGGSQRRCYFDESASINVHKKQDFVEPDTQRGDQLRILGCMWFYTASNDESSMKIYNPTPLQDIDPQNLA